MVSVSLLNGVRSSTCPRCVATPLTLDKRCLGLSLTICHNRLERGPERLLARGYLLHPLPIRLRVLALNGTVSLLLEIM
jgi:hypothetical protein